MFSKMLLSFISLMLLLTAQIRSVKSLPWDVNHHPNHNGHQHPKNYISGNLPDYPPNLPGWVSDSLICREPYIDWDAPKLNVLYVAAHFCTYIAPLHTYSIRPVATLKKDYQTYQFFDMAEDWMRNVDEFTVMVEDMGEDCKVRWNPNGDRVDEPGEGNHGFAPTTRPSETEGRDWANVLRPFGGESDNTNLCTQLLYNSWAMCDNHGRGGWLPVEAGCLRYSLIPKGGPVVFEWPWPDDHGRWDLQFRPWYVFDPNIAPPQPTVADPDQASNYA